MHRLRTVPGGWNPGEEGVIDIDQRPGDIVFLSSGDTELNCLVQAYRELKLSFASLPVAFPSLRVVNLGSLKQELTIDNYVDAVVSRAKLVIGRLLGGRGYYPYLVERIQDVCERGSIPLLWVPGYNEPEPELLACSLQIDPDTYQRLWQGFNHGGVSNLTQVLAQLMSGYLSIPILSQPYTSIPDIVLHKGLVGRTHESAPVVGLVVYRAHFLANNMQPFEALMEALYRRGINTRCVLATTLRDQASVQEVIDTLTEQGTIELKALIQTTSFSTKPIHAGTVQSGFAKLDVPILQAIVGSCTHASWETGDHGLPPMDIAMHVALPEVDGRIITTPLSFKSEYQRDEETDSDLTHYEAHSEGVDWIASLTTAWVRLSQIQPSQRRIALVLPNYPNKDARLANGVGLDTPASVVEIIKALRSAGYNCGENPPQDSDELMQRIVRNVTNDLDTLSIKPIDVVMDHSEFCAWIDQQHPALLARVADRWGPFDNDPHFFKGQWRLAGFISGNIWITIQPSRGFDIDLSASYHCPELPPPWGYLAFYAFLQMTFEAHAVVHIGKHGNLEWLPGKSLALSKKSCFPAMLIPPVPHLYPFIVNDPGEGTQAKRRTHALIIDHLIPPMTRAELYGPLIELEQAIDEYYECADLDPERKDLLQQHIRDLTIANHLAPNAKMETKPIEEVLVSMDTYLCEIKEAQIRDGLHILGQVPQGQSIIDTLVALHRMPSGNLPGLTQALAKDIGWVLDPLQSDFDTAFHDPLYPGIHNHGDAIAHLETLAAQMVEAMLQGIFPTQQYPKTASVLEYMETHTLPNLRACKNEVTALLRALDGRFVESGPSGAPTRGRLDVLPTGRNFYSVDLRAIPTKTAWEIGKRSAERVVQRYIQENGEYPHHIGLTVWGTSTMRTGGDDLAQAFALMGVRPVWQGINQRIVDFEVLSILELGRPRVDVTLRISGFFRDAFPDQISLFQAAVEKVMGEADEELDDNPLRKSFLDEQSHWQKQGFSPEQALQRAHFRVFGSKPGAYGAGLQELISNRNWETREDLAQAYLNWSCYAYSSHRDCHVVPDVLSRRLIQTQIILQNQDNREHDILDSDDYYQFQGGMANAARALSGKAKTIYFGDHSRPDNPRIKTLQEEILKVYHSRVINPKWIRGVQRHGYKGAFEMAATVDYVFAFSATTDSVPDFIYEGITHSYLLDPANRAFFEKHNPWALKDISERLLEAMERNLWKQPTDMIKEQLRQILLDTEGLVEDQL
ncbi:MAG: cobaltochelatase subunit CobN [Opitutales bacterium]|nr:cobaltochelatase subunit CobN [Opitutales bacterium]